MATRILRVGDICIIKNKGQHHQEWLDNHLDDVVVVTQAEEGVHYVYVEKFDGEDFNPDTYRQRSRADIWNDNLELASEWALKCAECQELLKFGVVDYLCQSCRSK